MSDQPVESDHHLNDLKESIKAELKEELRSELSLKANENDVKVTVVVNEDEEKKEESTTTCFGNDEKKDEEEKKEEEKKEEEKKEEEKKEEEKEEEKKEEKKEEEVKEKFVSSLSLILTICGKALQRDIEVSEENIIVIVHAVMESIEMLHRVRAIRQLEGEHKKQLCLDCMKWIISNQPSLSDDDRVSMVKMVDRIVPNTIDKIVEISNGDSDLVLSLTDGCCKPLGCMPSLCMFNIRCCCM